MPGPFLPTDSAEEPFFNETIDLSGSAYQGLSSITFRFFGTSSSSSTVLNYDSVNLNGSVVNAVPEPATWAFLLGGLACGGALLRRRVRRSATDRP